MRLSLGIDLGTGSVKALLVDLQTGSLQGLGQAAYGYAVKDGQRAERSPNVLKRATFAAIRAAMQTASVKSDDVVAIGFSGQMRGMVLLDERATLLTNVVTWEDQRSSETVLSEIRRTGGWLVQKSGCGIAKGFAGPTLYAIKTADRKLFRRARTLLCPTDWIRREIAQEDGFLTDTSNGSSSGFFDTASRRWNKKLLERLDIAPGISRNPNPFNTHTTPKAAANIVTKLVLLCSGMDAAVSQSSNAPSRLVTAPTTLRTLSLESLCRMAFTALGENISNTPMHSRSSAKNPRIHALDRPSSFYTTPIVSTPRRSSLSHTTSRFQQRQPVLLWSTCAAA